MDYIDILLAIPLIWGAFMGFKKGLILELSSLVSLALGIYGALKFSDFTAGYLVQYVDIPQQWIGLSSFIITFLFIIIGVSILSRFLDKLLKVVALGLVNRILGLLFGMLKYAIILSIFLHIFGILNQKFKFYEKNFEEDSLIYQPLITITKPLIPLLKNFSIEEVPTDVIIFPNGEDS